MRRSALLNRFNWVALGAIVVLCVLSLISQRNADYYSGESFYDRHVIWFLVGGFFGFLPAAFVDLRLVERASYWILGFSVLLLVLTVFFGTSVNFSKRWLRVGINIQASELAKIGVILTLARLFHNRRERVAGGEEPHVGPYGLKRLWKPALIVLIPCGLTIIQPDLGTTLLILLVGTFMVLYEGVSRRSLALLAVIGLVGAPVAWKYGGIQEYQKDRIRLWINADWFKMDPDTGAKLGDCNLQSEQAICAIGSGQFWGKGGQSDADTYLKHLPEMHTDMIVAAFAAERGFMGMTFLLLLFWLIVVWGLRTAHDARDRFCRLVAVGVAAMIGLQVFVNIGMVAGLLPVVGLPLPIMSYGGSAFVTTLFGLGLVLNIALRRGRL